MQEIERKEDAFGFTARDFQVTSIRRTDGENDLVKILVDVFGRNVLADFGIADKLDASRFEKFHAAVDDGLVKFPVRNAITEQTANFRVLFVNSHRVTLAAERFGGKEARRTGTDDSGSLPVGFCRREFHQALLEGGFNDELLNLAHHHRVIVHVAGTGRFAKRRADASREFREEGCLADDIVGAFQISGSNSRIEFGNQIAQRTTRTMTERNAARMATSRLVDDFD